ncbi:Peptidase M15 [bacterium YEK0313]|nr:Peptidase M15 [bacterium YEK0313]
MLVGGQTQTVVANGDTRTLPFVHRHTGEELLITFKRNGRYDQEALNRLNWFLRDWRTDQPTRMDPGLFDLLWEVYRGVGGQAPINVLSAYRSEGTNAMLRRRSRAVAQHSQHIQGRAMDFFIPGVSMTRVREVGLQLQRGGVGFYPGSANHFIHLDTGSVRHWPKVSRDYLARLFPDGRTVHIPADGRPMPGFDVALAMVQARGGSASRHYDSRADEADEGPRGFNIFALLFGGANRQAAQPVQQPAPQQPSRTMLAQRGSGGRMSATLRPGEAAPEIPARNEPAVTQVAQAAPPPPAQGSQVPSAGGRAGTPMQILPNAPRMQIAMAPIPVRAPSAAERARLDAEQDGESELMQRIASGPMPMARPTIPGQAEPPAPTVVAAFSPPLPTPVPEAARQGEPNRPMPLAEPQPATERVQVAQAPMPPARPQIIGGSAVVAAAALPALITTGNQRGQVVFTRQTTDREAAVATLTTPDPRQTRLIAQPDHIVAMSFSPSSAATMPTQRFAGQAVTSLRTLDFAPAEPAPERRASLDRR